jgi:flavin reductase (DIM6/NTAB) family NADH-FMN oxidoreductase RutF
MAARFDTRAFRRALGRFVTGVTVITTSEADGTPRGFTANSFTSVSLDPPLLLVCIAKSAASCPIFCAAARFSINILAEEQGDISGLFATQSPNKFRQAAWHHGPAGTPLIDAALAWFECARHESIEAGDHVILIGRVEAFDCRDGRPLGYLEGRYFRLGLEDSIIDAAGRHAATILGAIYENDGAVLLEHDPAKGVVCVPAVGRDGRPANLARLGRRFAGAAMQTSIEFVYAVFEDRGSNTVSIYYRGRASGTAPPGTAYFDFSAIPWDRFADAACRTMLQRYVDEAKQGAFAIYMGNESEGVVRPVGR